MTKFIPSLLCSSMNTLRLKQLHLHIITFYNKTHQQNQATALCQASATRQPRLQFDAHDPQYSTSEYSPA